MDLSVGAVPTAQAHACAPWVSQQSCRGCVRGGVPLTGLDCCCACWSGSVKIKRRDLKKGCRGTIRLPREQHWDWVLCFRKEFFIMCEACDFLKKKDTYERKKERGKDIFHPWWSILSDKVWKSFYICYVKSYLYAEMWETVVNTPPSSGRAMGATRKPRLHEWRLMEQSTWVQAMSIILL